MTDKPDHEAATAWAKVIKRQKRLHPSLRDEDAINLARCYLERCAELAALRDAWLVIINGNLP